MNNPPKRFPLCNLLRDGVDYAAAHAQRAIRNKRGMVKIVVRPDGSLRSYRHYQVPPHDEGFVIGTYNARASRERIANDLLGRIITETPEATSPHC